MSILIRGMEMPETCFDCPCRDFEFHECGAAKEHLSLQKDEYGDEVGDIPEWCPLVEVPTPHGRLIDADAYCAEMKKRQDAAAAWRDDIKSGGGYGTELYFRSDSVLSGFIEAKLTMDKIPTIIEAEGKEENE